MLATVQALRVGGQSCEARSGNDILFVFAVPPDTDLRLSHVLELDPSALNQPQLVRNVTTGQSFKVVLKDNDVHDLRVPSSHGTNRTPSPERLGGA
jgi:hypothetical protein